ncbi:MAG: histidine kinase dimerization/phospho-acceptor domain-containing protein [Propionivibrio sp.]
MKRILQARTTVPRLWLIALLLWLAVAVAAGAILWHLHRNVLEGQSREIRLLSLALTDETDRGLHGVEDGLKAIRVQVRAGKMLSTDGEAEARLNALSRLIPLVRSLWLIGPDGRLLAASDRSPAPDLSSFRPPLDAIGNETPAVSRSFFDLEKHEALVAMALRFESTPAIPVRWIVASIPAQTLLGALATDSPVTDAHLAVFRDDGTRLAGSLVNAPPRDELTTAAILENRPAIYLHEFRDGTRRLVSQHALSRYGLKMVLTRDIDTALATWRDTAEISVVGLTLLLAILAAAVFLVVDADHRRAKTQHALQTQQARVSRLESLGALSGGVAHDFNNIFAAILGFGEMAQDAAPPASPQARHLDKVLQAVLRGKSLAERILTFSRGGAHRLIVFELAPIVERSAESARRLARFERNDRTQT